MVVLTYGLKLQVAMRCAQEVVDTRLELKWCVDEEVGESRRSWMRFEHVKDRQARNQVRCLVRWSRMQEEMIATFYSLVCYMILQEITVTFEIDSPRVWMYVPCTFQSLPPGTCM